MDNTNQNSAANSVKNHFDPAALLAMSPTAFTPSSMGGGGGPPIGAPYSPFPLLSRGSAFQPPLAPSPPNSLLEGMASRSTTHAPTAPLSPGAWWSSAEQGMALAGLLRQGLPPDLAGSSKLDHGSRSSPQPRRIVEEMLGHAYSKPSELHLDYKMSGLNGSQSSNKMLPPSAHSRSPKHLDMHLDMLTNSAKEKSLGSSTKLPPSLPPHFLPRLSSAELTISSINDGGGRGSLSSPIRDRMDSQSPMLKRGRRTPRKEPSLALQPTEGASSKQPPGSELNDGGRLSSAGTSLFPSPAHSVPGYAAPQSKPTTRTEPPSAVCGAEGAAPLDLCVKKGASTTFLSPEVTLTPVPSNRRPPTPRSSQSGTPSPGLHQMHILETLTASLGQPRGQQVPSRRRGRKSRDSLLPPPAVLGNLFAALGAQDMKLSPKEQESLQRFQLLASQGYKSKNNVTQKPTNSSLMSEMAATLDKLHTDEERVSQMSPDNAKVNRKRVSPEHSDSHPRDSGRESKRPELDRSASGSESSSESESAGDSQSLSGNSDTEDTEKSAAASTSSSIRVSGSERGPKRHKDEFERSPKRRRYHRGEQELRAPLERGWQRQTKIRCFSKGGIRGEVFYIAPCGKKLKSYPEVMRYLQKNSISDIGRENFSFSTKVNVGDFVEAAGNGGPDTCMVLSGEEVAARLQQVQGLPRSSASLGIVRRGRPRTVTPDPLSQEVLKQHVEESRRHQERLEQLEQQRIEKELRAQHMIEIRRQRREELERQRQEDSLRRSQERENKRQQTALLREQELQKRREMLLMVDLERERRRQHMLLVRALENRKKFEDQRKMDLQILKEVRRPVEDMRLKDALPLPTLNRIPGLKIPGTAFANLLMVQEFLHNFGETLHFDVEKIPTLNTLQLALINHDEKSEQEFLTVVQHLLTCAIHDPGTPHCKEAVTVLGQHLKDAPITNESVTEAFHLYFMALDKECAMYQWVTEKPFLALNPTQKSEIMAFLCNELLCSRAVVRQVDSSIDTVNTLRKDKWLAEGELRKLRGIQQARQRKALLRQDQEEAKGAEEATKGDGDKAVKGPKTEEEEENEEGGNESGNDSEDPQDAENDVDEEDGEPNLSNEDLEKKIDKLAKQQAQFQSKVAKASSTIRASMLGQDRFRRRYWLLPIAGGVFVEAMESGEQDGMGDFVASDYMIDEDDDEESQKSKKEAKDVKVKMQEKESDTAKRKQPEAETKQNEDVKKEEQPKDEKETVGKVEEKAEAVKKAEVKEEVIKTESEKEIEINKEVQPSAEVKPKVAVGPEGNLEQAWMMQSPFLASMVAGNLLFAQGGKDGGGGDVYPHVTAEQMLKTLAQQKRPWFSILPRVPCDEESLARLPGKEGEDDIEVEEEAGAHQPGGWVSVIETEDTTNQHDKPQAVPADCLRGWWRITDVSQLRAVMTTLHTNGIREKALLKQLEKSFNYGAAAAIPNSQQDVGLEITERDREVSEKHGGAVPPDYEDQWSPEVALRVDLTVLEQVEILEEKVVGASMQAKGWRPQPKASNDITREFRPSCVLLNKKLLSSSEDGDDDDSLDNSPSSTNVPEDKETVVKPEAEAPSADPALPQPSPKINEDGNNQEEGALEDKSKEEPQDSVDHEGVEVKKQPDGETGGADKVGDSMNPVHVAKERLLCLEAAIERRYMRPPLGTSILPQQPSGVIKWDEETGKEEEEVPPGLLRWRQAVQLCQTAAQLSMCLAQLEGSIAWDRSIMKASCQFCHSGDNEEMLLLCDGCDKGYHTYCFKPKMDNIPEGDWYCYECLNKTQEEKVCVLCGKKGKLVHCDGCPKVFHMTCLEPPLTKPPKGKWTCSGCSKARKKGRPSKEPKEAKEQPAAREAKETTAKKAESPSPVKAKAGERREKNKSQVLKDLAACRVILDEMEKHKDSWPFLLPVNTKQFPSYRKFIKKPMDVSTIRSKLESGQYKLKDEFAGDARLIFDNCETFNEDDSPVGQAGHSLRNYFECRWEELTS
ncbi:bromodomain adjacent to zinc finger domain protein 2B-like isoform X2 [Ornithodoros turicata]